MLSLFGIINEYLFRKELFSQILGIKVHLAMYGYLIRRIHSKVQRLHFSWRSVCGCIFPKSRSIALDSFSPRSTRASGYVYKLEIISYVAVQLLQMYTHLRISSCVRICISKWTWRRIYTPSQYLFSNFAIVPSWSFSLLMHSRKNILIVYSIIA